jgi:hypothetical protein
VPARRAHTDFARALRHIERQDAEQNNAGDQHANTPNHASTSAYSRGFARLVITRSSIVITESSASAGAWASRPLFDFGHRDRREEYARMSSCAR